MKTNKHIHDKVFPNIVVLIDWLIGNGIVPGWHSPNQFELMGITSPDDIVAVPMPTNPLFRGQNKFYEPCLSTFDRREWTHLELLEREIQLADFKSMLKEHPEVRGLNSANMKVHYLSMAQHYGIETHIIDLTNSPLVAAFFATTEYHSLTNTYQPILCDEGEGVLYVLEIGGLFDFGQTNKVLPIGQEALRRPGEQRAYGHYSEDRFDFNNYHVMRIYRFRHSRNASLQIWDMTGGGTMLFPYDPMAEKVYCMRKYRIYSEEGLTTAYSSLSDVAPTIEDAKKQLEEAGCTFVNHLPFAYTNAEKEYVEIEYQRMYSNQE